MREGRFTFVSWISWAREVGERGGQMAVDIVSGGWGDEGGVEKKEGNLKG